MAKPTLNERFWSKVAAPDENGCLRWTAGKFTDGYGVFRYQGRSQGAHRVAYDMLVGAVPEGLQLDHLCRVRDCVNVEHLEPVTQQENMRRGVLFERCGSYERAKTHCKQGHEFTPENIVNRSRGGRDCKVCHREREARKRLAAGIKPRKG